MALRMVIVADDLTGACDTGAAFAARGLRTVVWLTGPQPSSDVLVRSTNSRNDPPEVAAVKVRQAAAIRAPILYKKIDSTLRGNVRAELEVLDTSIVVCPAFPDQQRVVRDGWLRAPGIDVDLRTLLTGLNVETRDASTAADLRRLALELLDRDPVPVIAGSAGLGREIADVIGAAPRALESTTRPGRAILCIGSTHPVTLAQISDLEQSRRAGYEINPADFDPAAASGLFLCGGDTAAGVCERLRVEAIELLGEIQPGVPAGRILGGVASGVPVVTKSGGFHVAGGLGCILDYLSAQNHKSEC